eukprot:8647652-Alexandrium_andersonii.AAC.1
MSASLVGSEMCIRDRCWPSPVFDEDNLWRACGSTKTTCGAPVVRRRPVSYTHLTLPTICSV